MDIAYLFRQQDPQHSVAREAICIIDETSRLGVISSNFKVQISPLDCGLNSQGIGLGMGAFESPKRVLSYPTTNII